MEFLSSEWIDAWVARCNADGAFVAAGEGFYGVVVAVIDPDHVRPGPRRILRLEGTDGIWTRVQLGTGQDLANEPTFTLTAPYLTWKSVILGELDPIRGLVSGRLRVEGQLSTVLRWSEPFRLMVALADGLATTFAAEEPRG